ncbi:hypothetical protein RJ641_036639 [Dillenia turbinata]|uniref:Uncharacterized protein n=1 Tax=Dillenia turbinata TaxID=194707 RepID=A0AAN8VGD1_9MAGN
MVLNPAKLLQNSNFSPGITFINISAVFLSTTTILNFYLYALSPQVLCANCMSFGMIVTLLAWITRLVPSNNPTNQALAASYKVTIAELWKWRSVLKSCMISHTKC